MSVFHPLPYYNIFKKKNQVLLINFCRTFYFYPVGKNFESNPASKVIGITFVPITACKGEPSNPRFPILKAKIIEGFQGKFFPYKWCSQYTKL